MSKKLTICVDFDGTCTTHEYPLIGREIGAVPVLKRLVAAGHKLILFTMRSGIEQTHAENWFADNDIPLYGSQTNPTQKNWTASPKAYGQLYIDDAALGCPLIHNGKDRPYVDWKKVEIMLELKDILPDNNPITVNKFKEIFHEATIELGNGETAINVQIITKDDITKITYHCDCGRAGTATYDNSYVTIKGDQINCVTCERLEGSGIEEFVQKLIKKHINGNTGD